MQLIAVLFFCFLYCEAFPQETTTSEVIPQTTHSETQTVERSVDKNEIKESESHANATIEVSAENKSLLPCQNEDCSNKGTCLGTKKSHICICQLGYSGPNCEDVPCESTRDCSSRGICMGTARHFNCFCHIGFSGLRCEVAAN